MSASTGTSEFVSAMGPVARELLGDPDDINKIKQELRWGTRGSFKVSLDTGTWFNNETGQGGGVLKFVQDEKHLDKDGAIAWLQERGHISKPATVQQIAWYDYLTASGEVLFQVVRFKPKDFRQRRPDGKGDWIWKTAGLQLIPYRLPEVVRAIGSKQTVYIAEGEKGVQALESIGLTGTCSPGGAGKWRARYNSTFAGADVVVLPDNDPQAVDKVTGEPRWHLDGRPVLPGQDHAADIARNLSGVARRVRVVMLPNLPIKGDVADWIAAGGTAAQLEEIAAGVPDFDAAANPKPKPAPAPTTSLEGFDLTEDGIALAFTKEHQDALRYDHSIGKWFQWTGKSWRQDETKVAFSWSRRTCRQIAREANAEDGELRTIARAATAAAVERFAQSDPLLAVTSAIWDRDTYLLGTPGGTLDLRTGELRDPTREDHITKLTAVTPSVMPECPKWLAFLEQVTKGDTGLIRFLKQWCGYCLTGDVSQHALLFAHGPGGNGKGVFINTVSWIMGDYAIAAAMDTFVASDGNNHPTDLAMLRGARMVMVSETEEGRAWAESRIKLLTGGDKIRARFMRQDFFEYMPQFKLNFIGNHKPVLKNVDDAAKRRINMVPFLFKPTVVDFKLEEKLQEEGPGILRWMIEG
ncbi:phage/plasmid primase, P4 family, partial [Acidisphaera sp. S103]|uniref:phage/plasmid primase, P4 family n=1 Tax=Acidisphaera sp. S103 TaxID=1747223 RepID=UPI0020B153A1